MQKFFSLLFILFIFLGCSQKYKPNKIEEKTNIRIPIEKQITYGLQLNMKLPYELYVNDIKAAYNYVGGNIGVDMNPYLLRNGKCKIRIKIFPAFKAGKIEMSIIDIQNSTILFGKYIRGNESGNIHDYNLDDFTKLNYKLPNKPVPIFDQEWEIDIKELPYEVEGWSKGQDLRKFEQKDLENKVVNYFKDLRELLNNGDGEKYIELWKTADVELVKYDYDYNVEEINKDEVNIIKNKCKNMMIPLDDYEMKLYAEGKLVTLERKTNTNEFNNKSPLDLKGMSPLIRLGQKAGAVDYPVLLYLPQNSNEFVIIRK